jgi:hypothetical protein
MIMVIALTPFEQRWGFADEPSEPTSTGANRREAGQKATPSTLHDLPLSVQVGPSW